MQHKTLMYITDKKKTKKKQLFHWKKVSHREFWECQFYVVVFLPTVHYTMIVLFHFQNVNVKQ